MKKTFRHELKYLLPDYKKAIIMNNLRQHLQLDSHVNDKSYQIRSIYFDDYLMSAYSAVLNGISEREKYRIRFYDLQQNHILLEKKSKTNNMTNKISCPISMRTFENCVKNESELKIDDNPFINEFNLKKVLNKLRPVCYINYERIPFVYKDLNIRVTIDYNITVSKMDDNWFSNNYSSFPLLENGYCIIEIKYDEFLPEFIRSLLQLSDLQRVSYSKYALGIQVLEQHYRYI